MTEKINPRQIALFCSMLLFTSKLITLPSLFYQSNGTASIFSLIAIFFLEIIILYFFIKLKEKNNNISIFDFLYNKIGKFIAKIIIFILFLFFIFKILFILEEKFSFLKQALYGDATIWVYLICVLPVINSLVHKGLNSFSRTLEIFYPFIIAGFLFCTVIWISTTSNFGFDILYNKGLAGFTDSFFSYTFWFGDFLFFIIILDKLKIQKNYGKTIMKFAIFSATLCIIYFLSFFYIFQSSAFYHTDAILDIIQFSSELGNVGKLDIIALTSVMFVLFFQTGMYLYCARDCLCQLIPFREKIQPMIVLNLIMILGMYMIFNNTNLALLLTSVYLKYLAFLAVYGVPILLYFLNNKNNKNKKYYKKSIKNINFN